MKEIKFDIQRFVETINGTAGHDNISVTASQQFINALGGNDTIRNSVDRYSNITISGGDGADSILSGYWYNSSNYYPANNISISAGAGNDYVSITGSNATVNGDEGDDYIYTNKNNNSLNGGSGDDYLEGNGENVTIFGESGNDTVYSNGSYEYIEGGEGKDWLRTESGSNITIMGGYGDDYLRTKNSTNGSMIGGSGADTLMVMGSPKNITIMGGWGNDSISLESGASALIYFSSSDDNDIVYGFDTNDTLQIAGSSFSTTASDNNVIVTAGSGKVTLVGTTGKSLNIQMTNVQSTPSVKPDPTPTVPASTNTIVYSGGNKTISSYSESQQVNLATDFTGVEVDGDNFIVKSSSGKLTLQNVRGKYVKYGDANSNLVAYSYMGTNGSGSGSSSNSSVSNSYSSYDTVGRSSNSSVKNSYSGYNTIDAKSKGAFYDVLIGGNNVDDSIVASSGGSSLWGGNGGNDTLVGGSGYDEYIYKYGNGNDVIQGANWADLVDLSSIKLSQITSADVRLSGVTIRFTNGSSLKVEGNASGMSYKVAEGTFRCNQYNGQWTTK